MGCSNNSWGWSHTMKTGISMNQSWSNQKKTTPHTKPCATWFGWIFEVTFTKKYPWNCPIHDAFRLTSLRGLDRGAGARLPTKGPVEMRRTNGKISRDIIVFFGIYTGSQGRIGSNFPWFTGTDIGMIQGIIMGIELWFTALFSMLRFKLWKIIWLPQNGYQIPNKNIHCMIHWYPILEPEPSDEHAACVDTSSFKTYDIRYHMKQISGYSQEQIVAMHPENQWTIPLRDPVFFSKTTGEMWLFCWR